MLDTGAGSAGVMVMVVIAQGLLDRPDATLDLAVLAVAVVGLVALAAPAFWRRRSRPSHDHWSPTTATSVTGAPANATPAPPASAAPKASAGPEGDAPAMTAMSALRAPAVQAAARRPPRKAGAGKRAAPPVE